MSLCPRLTCCVARDLVYGFKWPDSRALSEQQYCTLQMLYHIIIKEERQPVPWTHSTHWVTDKPAVWFSSLFTSQNIRNTVFLHVRLKPIWKNKLYFNKPMLRWIFLPVYLSKGHRKMLLQQLHQERHVCTAAWCRAGVFGFFPPAKKKWNGTKSIQQCPSKCSRRERDPVRCCIAVDALQWPCTAIFREHLF